MPRIEIRHLWDIFKLILKLIRETIKKKKIPVNKNKNQALEPMHQKYEANENKSRHNPKEKQKQNNQQK